ncbi:hypothetical protein [Streptomyces regalis]|uniref:Uncharacterized protein n=1 Tax=Streptomyces regalis TaxID=68262 RepID=A0A101J702_9ACTN|nr:hypothetical protein [Streptomyces regalis]KUL21376.1 hypothetical protein ADL12_44910 [Streptomyces regalis]
MPADRFILLEPGAARPGRIPLPPAFAVKATTDDTEGRLSLLEVTVSRPPGSWAASREPEGHMA